jgi:hypothetical protein
MDKNVAYLDNFLSGNSSLGESDLPAYMANNFHINDIAIDKRGEKHNTVKIVIPKNSIKTNSLEPAEKDDTMINDVVPQVSDGTGDNIDNDTTNDKGSNSDSNINNNTDNTDNNSNDNTNNNTNNNTTDSGINLND